MAPKQGAKKKQRGGMSLMQVMGIMALGFAVFLGWVYTRVTAQLAYGKQLSWSDDLCKLLPLDTPTEDLSAVGDDHCAFAGGGDLWNTFMSGSSTAKPGAIYMLNATEGSVRKLKITGASPPPTLVLHGIYFSQITLKLYAVNHDEELGESVEVFKANGDCATMELEHIKTVRSPLFGVNTLNDVVEGVDGEFYVSEWQPFPFPKGGKKNPAASFQEKMGRLAVVLTQVFSVASTRVFRCTLEDGCTVASTTRFVGANGLAVTDDRQTVFVNDPPAQTVYVLSRGSKGNLYPVSQFKSKHILDNLEMQSDGKLTAGTIPLPYTCETTCEDAEALSATEVVGGREVGCGKSPGGALVISLVGTGGQSFVDGTQTDKVSHDGSKLSGVAAALRLGGKVAMGGPNAPGILLCGE